MLGGVVGGRRKYIWVGSNARLGSFASACPDHGDFRSTPVTGHSQLAGRISEAQSALCCATSVACTTLRPMPDYRRAFVPGGCWFFTVNPRYRRCCVASRASEIPQVECDISTRRAKSVPIFGSRVKSKISENQKYLTSLSPQITCTSIAIPSHSEGRRPSS